MTRSLFAGLVACAALWAAPLRADEAALSSQLSTQAEKLLESLLGPGRARVLVTVEGDTSETRTQKELSTPVAKADAAALPGYAQDKPRETAYTVTSQELAAKTGFSVRRVRAVVLVDRSVAQARVDEVNRVLPQALFLDFERGDELSFVRADLLPAWKSILSAPEGLRAALLLLGALGLVFLAGLLFHATAMRVTRLLLGQIGSRQAALPVLDARAVTSLDGPGLPELTEGEIPGMLDGGGLSLGRRFDFLAGKSSPELSRLLETESVEDLALLFAHLADSDPALAASAFAALDPARQTAVSQALAKLTQADPERLSLLEIRLRAAADLSVRGTQTLGRLLSRLPPERRESLLGEVAAADPAAASEAMAAMRALEQKSL